MAKIILFWEQWTKQIKDPKKRRFFFLCSLVIIYFIWFFLFINPLQTKKRTLQDQIQALQAQPTEIQQKIDATHQAIKKESIAKALEEQKQLSEKIKNIQQRLAKIHLLSISADDWVKLKKDILTQQEDIDSNITLISIHDLPVQTWMPDNVDKTDLVNTVPVETYQHALEVEFQADYFSTVQYLSRLEKMPWPVYWDSLQYRVLTYPKADIILKLHVFTQQSKS